MYKKYLHFIIYAILICSFLVSIIFIVNINKKYGDLNDEYKYLKNNFEKFKVYKTQEQEKIINQKDTESKLLKEEVINLKKQFDELMKSNEVLIKEKNELKKNNDDIKNKVSYNKSSGNKKTTYFTSNNTVEKKAYLTFDDGPSDNTTKILNILDDYEVKATFFVNGRTNEFAKKTYKRIVDSGHTIANHTYSHNYKSIYKSIENFENDFKKLETLIYNVTGVKNKLMRFPGGSNNNISRQYGGSNIMYDITQEMIKNGYLYFDWNVDSGDARKVKETKNNIVNNVLNNSKNKNNIIVLMHDSSVKTTTADALPEIIEGLLEQGFTFEAMSENSFVVQFLRPVK